MTYITGTVEDANGPAALYAILEPAFLAAGYTLVDTVVISTRTHKVFKNPAANNPANLDWWVDVVYTTTGAGLVAFYPYEYYDPATHLAYRGAFYNGNNSFKTAPDSTYWNRNGNAGYTLESPSHGNIPTGTSYNTNTDMTVGAGASGYWISVTNKRIAAIVTAQPNRLFYTGLYDPAPDFAANAGAALFPLVCMFVYAGTSGQAILTRYPRDTTVHHWVPRSTSGIATGGLFPQLPAGEMGYSAIRRASKVVLQSAIHTSYGTFGWLYDVAVVPADATVTRGDTVILDGVPWVLTTGNGNWSYLVKTV